MSKHEEPSERERDVAEILLEILSENTPHISLCTICKMDCCSLEENWFEMRIHIRRTLIGKLYLLLN